MTWHEHAFTVDMPLMAPGERLSEVELLKQLALFQWEAIAAMLGCPPSRIESELGERLFLGTRFGRPLSSALVACLSTEHRKVYYFGNAAPDDTIAVYLSARCGATPGATASGPYRTPCRFVFRHDLHRRSDGALIASSAVQKALVVPAKERGVLLEAERFLAALG